MERMRLVRSVGDGPGWKVNGAGKYICYESVWGHIQKTFRKPMVRIREIINFSLR